MENKLEIPLVTECGVHPIYAEYLNRRGNFTEDGNMKTSHYHDHYEIYCYLGDSMTYFLEDRPWKLTYGDIILVDRYVYHRTFYYRENSHERINVSFQPQLLRSIGDSRLSERLGDLFKKPVLQGTDAKTKLKLKDNLLRLCEAYSENSSASILRATYILYEFLLSLLDLSDRFADSSAMAELNVAERRISEIVRCINACYNEKLTLNSLAERFFLNRYYLCHSFRKVTGMGVTEFINRKRLSEAEMLLKYSDLSITRICEKTGFECHGHFIGMFRKIYGCTPRDYRKQYKNTLTRKSRPFSP